MKKDDILQRLNDIKQKQHQVLKTWQNTGNWQLLKFFIDTIPRTLDVERCSIFVLDPVEGSVWLKCGTGLEEQSIKVPTANSVVGEVISSGKVRVVDDLENRVGMHDIVGVEVGYFPKDTMCVPIFAQTDKKVIGAIQVLNKTASFEERKYTQLDREILERLAVLLAISVENIFMKQELFKISQEMAEEISLLEYQVHQQRSI